MGTDETTQPTIQGGTDEADLQDEVDEGQLNEEKELLEDELRRLQKVDSVTSISSLRMKPEHLFRLRIPLWTLVSMPMVRPTLSCDIVKLEQEFVHGYRDGAAVFYVSTRNEARECSEFNADEIERFGPLWRKENDVFEKHLSSVAKLKFLKNKKFFVCDGNHRLIAWMNHISRLHSADPSWHITDDCILLETKGRIELVMQIMHDINK